MATDAMSVRLHLKRLRVTRVLVDEINRLEVEVADTRSVVRCPFCEHKTSRVHEILDPATGQTRPLTEGFGDVLGHSWSPQGERIVFTRASTEGSIFGDLWLVDVRTQEAELLAEGEYAWPEWSRDGEAIAYVTTRAGQPFVAYLDRTADATAHMTCLVIDRDHTLHRLNASSSATTASPRDQPVRPNRGNLNASQQSADRG